MGISKEWIEQKSSVSEEDLTEYKASFHFAKKRESKPFESDYYIGYYQKLPYVVPIAFQGSVAMIFDLEGNIINNVYNPDTKYKIKTVGICIFPLKESSVIMLFIDKGNKRYSNFFRQLKKLDLENQLSIINYIIFAYTEDYFLSPDLDEKVLNKLMPLSGKTSEMIGFYPTTIDQRIEGIRKIYDFDERFSTPNLLTQDFLLSRENL